MAEAGMGNVKRLVTKFNVSAVVANLKTAPIDFG